MTGSLIGRTLAVVLLATAFDAPPGALRYPPARRGDTTELIHGIAVEDPYRWLEDQRSPETVTWVGAQEGLLKEFLRNVPEREAMQRRILELSGTGPFQAPVKAGGRYFLLKSTASGVPTGLWVQDRLGGTPRRLLDPKTHLGKPDVTLGGFSPGPDGRFVAYSVSEGQSRWQTIRVLDVSRGTDLPTPGLETNSIAGPIVWSPDAKGFFFTRYDRKAAPAGVEPTPVRPRISYYRLAERTEQAEYEPPDEPGLLVGFALTDDGRYLVLTLRDGSSGKARVFLVDRRRPDRPSIALIPSADANAVFLGSEERVFYFFTDRGAPRGRIVAVDLARPDPSNWRVVIPEGPDAIAASSAVGGNALGMFGNRFVLLYLKDGRPSLRVFDRGGRLLFEPSLPPGGLIWGGFSGGRRDPEVFYQFLGITEMGTLYRLDLRKMENSVFRREAIPFDRDSITVEQVFYKSKDGVQVPMFVAHKKGLSRDGRHPAYLYGYGSFGWVSFIWYQPLILAWIESGGVYAQPGIRGGGEYGESWHAAGAGRNRQRAIDDYLAAAEWLTEKRYSSRDRLVASGGSASGGLAAAAILQRPELFGAAVIDRPVLDMVRFDRFTQATYWVPEFGSPRDPKDFAGLFSWSPYHNVRPGRCYPPTLVLSGDRDQVAVPLHAYKFAAALQSAQACANPVLLDVMRGAGHNFGTTNEESASSWADEAAFLSAVLPRAEPPSATSGK